MTKDNITKLFWTGKKVAVVEFRGAEATRFAANAQTKSAEAVHISYRVESDDEQLSINHYLKGDDLKGFDVDKFNAGAWPFKKGDLVLWHIGGYQWTDKGMRASGTLEAIQ